MATIAIGSKVRFLNAQKRAEVPKFFPPVNTVGIVTDVNKSDRTISIDWQGFGAWWCEPEDVEVYEEEK